MTEDVITVATAFEMLNNKLGLSNAFIEKYIRMKVKLTFFNFYIAMEDQAMFAKAVKEKCGIEIFFKGKIK